MTVLFFLRMALYYLVMSVPVFHPGIVVSYDLPGWLLWFLAVPAEMVVAFFFAPPKLTPAKWFGLAALVCVVTLAVLSFSGGISWLIPIACFISFFLTLLVFHTGPLGIRTAWVEPFILTYVLYKVISFSRSSEAVAEESAGLTQFLLIFLIVLFLVYGMVLYFSGFFGKENLRRGIREGLIFVGGAIPVLLLFLLVLPSSFVEHSPVLNNINPDKEPPYYDYDSGDWRKGGPGNGRLNGKEGEDGEGKQGEGKLQGIPSERWNSGRGRGQGGKQYAVMLVVSKMDPVYSAESYWDKFDPVYGFQRRAQEPLNQLEYKRLLETWTSDIGSDDRGRSPVPVEYLSTLSERTVPYAPALIQPTVKNPAYHPFSYSYSLVSRISAVQDLYYRAAPPLSEKEKSTLAHYLEIPLEEEDRRVFQSHLDALIEGDELLFEKINAILKGFSTYQYELGFDDSVTTEKMRTFLEVSKAGDCTEFSNTAAILGRLAGIPSRVVTGYLASKGLQSPAHRQGIEQLQKVIEPLNQYPDNEIYLVTTAHRHSWVQYYLPNFGWVDFETTSEAIPPPPGFDPNAQDVVIPIIKEYTAPEEKFVFPWRFVGGVLLLLLSGIIVGLYLFRYGRELYLHVLSRRNDEKGMRALFVLLLMRLAFRGYPAKPAALTAEEFAEEHPELKEFARPYTRFRYGDGKQPRPKEAEELRVIARKILKESYVTTARRAMSIFSLKGIGIRG